MQGTVRSSYGNTLALSGPVYLLDGGNWPVICVSVIEHQEAWHHTLRLFEMHSVKIAVLSPADGHDAIDLYALLALNKYALDIVFICLSDPEAYHAYKETFATGGNRLKVSVALLSEHTVMAVARYLCCSVTPPPIVGVMNTSNQETVMDGWVGKDYLMGRATRTNVFEQTTLVLQNRAINPRPWNGNVMAIH